MSDQAPAAAAVAADFVPLGRLAIWSHLCGLWRSGDIPLISGWPIRVRFAALVGLAMLGALSFALVYSLAETRIGHMVEEQDSYRQLNDLAGDVRAKAAAVQTHAEHFLRQRDPAQVRQFREDAALVSAALDRMAALSGDGPMAAAVADLGKGFAASAAQFDRAAAEAERLGLTESEGVRGRLRSSVKAIEDELKMWPNAGTLPVTMLQMRLAEKNFMLLGRETDLRLHTKYANQFDFEIDASPLPASTRDDFRKLLASYVADMTDFGASSLALASESEQLRQQFQAMQPVLQQVFAYARDGMSQAISAQDGLRRTTGNVIAAVGVWALLSFCAISLILARSITQPVRLIQQAMEKLAGGDHGIDIPGIARSDEIGDMAKAVAVFKENAIAMVRMQKEQEQIRQEADAISRRRMLSIADTFEHTVKSVADLVSQNAGEIRTTATRMAERDETGGTRSLAVAEAAESSRMAVAAVAEAACELEESVRDISAQASAASQIVSQAVQELERTNTRVEGLSDLAGRIDGIVNLISDIAHRTNMLSLNATIEAQRAGEAGKGFAVVANEVKHLANQTADSTREIARQVAAIKEATGETVAAIGDIGGAIRRMDEIAGQVTRSVNRQAEVTGKISRCVEQVSHETALVTDGVVAVTQSAARYCAAAVRVLWAVRHLSKPAGSLKHEVDGFLGAVRSGT